MNLAAADTASSPPDPKLKPKEEESNPLARLGLELRAEPGGSLKRFTDFWENLYSWWLIWTFNPGSLRGKRFWRCQFWISREALFFRYGAALDSKALSGEEPLDMKFNKIH